MGHPACVEKHTVKRSPLREGMPLRSLRGYRRRTQQGVFPRPVFRNLTIDDSRHREWKNVQQGLLAENQEIRHLVVAGRMSLVEPFLQLLRAKSGLP